jgi:hypothetical protein
MLIVWLLALIGLGFLIGLSAVALIGLSRRAESGDHEDAFDLALAAVARIQTAAWKAVEEIRSLDKPRKED